MKIKSSSLFLASLLLVLLHIPFNAAQNQVVFPYDEHIRISSTDIKYYKVDLNITENIDISLSVIPTQESSPFKLFVSKNANNPNPSASNNDYSSVAGTASIIFISGQELPFNQTFSLYMTVICAVGQCEGEIAFEFSREYNIQADGMRHIQTAYMLNGASSAVVRLNVPATPDAERIVIHIDAIPDINDVSDPELDVFINSGNKIPFTDSGDNIPRSSWFDGKTIVIYKGTQLFCTDCNYTLSLKFNQNASISVQAQIFVVDTDLGGWSILDGVKKDKFNTYVHKVEAQRRDDNLMIEVKPQEGTLSLYINCEERPADFKKYTWRYDIIKPEEIVLTKREHEKCPSGVYYFLVYGTDDSVYSLRAIREDSNKIYVGREPITGDIFPNETITYEFFVPMFAAERVKIDLKSRAPLDMSIINCRFPTDCPGLLPGDIDYHYQVDPSKGGSTAGVTEFQFDVDQTVEGRVATIDPHGKGCYPILIEDEEFLQDPIPVCAYRITIFNGITVAHEYTLKVEAEEHQWLFIGAPKMATVEKDAVTYFVLYVPHQDVTVVNIHVTKFSGNIDIFVSRTNQYPHNPKVDETRFSHEGLIMFKDEPNLNGTYYIGVKGLETSSFTISSTVQTAKNKSEDYAQSLTEGLPQKGVLLPQHEHPGRFYKIWVDLPNDWQGTLKIAVVTLRGSVLVAVNNNGLVPVPNFHTWKATGGQEVEIRSDDPNFKRQETYYIGVFVDWTENAQEYQDIVYTIVYYLKSTSSTDGSTQPGTVNYEHMFLSPLTPFHRTIKKGEVDFYETVILPNDTGITLHKEADAGDVDLYVSINPDNEYPDVKEYDYSTKDTHKDWIELGQADLKKACESAATKICSIFIGVAPRANDDHVSYSLTMKRIYERAEDHNITQYTPLEDGRQLQLSVPTTPNEPAYFYFYTVPLESTVVTVACPGKQITIYANLNKTQLGKGGKANFLPPTSEAHIYSSEKEHETSVGLAHLTIPAQQDMTTTVVTLAVYFKHAGRIDAESDTSATFYILETSQMTKIYTGKPYFGAVEEGKYMYYILNVYDPEATLLVSMTTLNDGDPDLVVSTGQAESPTVESHQFASISASRTEVLEISKLDIYPLSSMEGQWIIGVYGRKASTYTLTVLYEHQKMVQLKPGVPFETYLKQDSMMYFKFYHGKANGIEIRLDQLSGETNVYVDTLTEGKDLASTLNSTESSWKIVSPKEPILSISSSDPNYCSECTYLIALEATAASKLSVTVVEGLQAIKLQNGMTYNEKLAKGMAKTYVLSSTNAEEVTLAVTLRGAALDIYASQNPAVDRQEHIWDAHLTSARPTKTLTLYKSAFEQKSESQVVWNGIEYVKSEKNSFYFRFENNGNVEISYSFIVTSEDSSPVLRSGVKHHTDLPPGAATSFIYYSSEPDDVLRINVEFSVERDLQAGLDQEFERNLRRGLPVSASFFAEKVTAGLGVETPLINDYVMRDTIMNKNTKRVYHLREAFSTASKVGKFSIDVENPFFSNVSIAVSAYTTEFGAIPLEANSQHSSTLTDSFAETFEVYLGEPGVWYFWAHSCNGEIDIGLGADPERLDHQATNHQLLSGKQLLNHYIMGEAASRYVKLTRGSQGEGESQFMISSSFFPGEDAYAYDPRNPPSKVQTEAQFQSLNSQIAVKFDPLDFGDVFPTDEIVYHAKVCPYKADEPDRSQNLCKIYEECKDHHQSYEIKHKEALEFRFDRLMPGQYYVQVTADIIHKGKLIRFVPYETEMVEIGQPGIVASSHHFLILLLIIMIVVTVGFFAVKGYKKFKKYGAEKGFELPAFGKRRAGYGFLGDEL